MFDKVTLRVNTLEGVFKLGGALGYLLIHYGIISFIIVIALRMLFGSVKEKAKAQEAGEEAAGRGCLLIVRGLILIARIVSG